VLHVGQVRTAIKEVEDLTVHVSDMRVLQALVDATGRC
jgi:hypothetical protein